MAIGSDEYIFVSPNCKACIRKMEYRDIQNPLNVISLTANQHKALAYIIKLDGEPATYEAILIEIESEGSDNNYVNKLISQIKKIIPGVYVLPIRSVGYKWNPPVQRDVETTDEPIEIAKAQTAIFENNKGEKNYPSRLKRFNLQTNLFFSKKKKSQNAIYIGEMIDKLVSAEEDDDVVEILDRIKLRVDSVVKDLMETATLESLGYDGLKEFAHAAQEEIEQILRITDNRLQLRESDTLGNLKRTMTDALRIYIIIRFLQLITAFGSLLLGQASTQIEKEASKIREDVRLKNIKIDKMAELLEVKENELEKAMINVYGGITV